MGKNSFKVRNRIEQYAVTTFSGNMTTLSTVVDMTMLKYFVLAAQICFVCWIAAAAKQAQELATAYTYDAVSF